MNKPSGQMSGSYERVQGAFKGPVWFLLIILIFRQV